MTTTAPAQHLHRLNTSHCIERPGVSDRRRRGRVQRTLFCAFSSNPSQGSEQKRRGKSETSDRREQTPEQFRSLERALNAFAQASEGAESRGWTKVDDSYVFEPVWTKSGQEDAGEGERIRAKRICHFVGGAFVGASPQLTYRVFLEKLARDANMVIVATPYELSFDHLRVVDDCQFKFDRAYAKLDEEVKLLPIVSIGHSMGAHVHALANSRYELKREALVLISYNNKPATDAIPLFAEVFVPGLSALSPVLQPLAASPLRESLRDVDKNVRNFYPDAVKEFLTVVDQLEPLLLDISNGRKEFQPTPDEALDLVKKYYSASNALLIKFKDDTIDETAKLAAALTETALSGGGKNNNSNNSNDTSSSGGARNSDFSVKTLKGDHIAPLWQPVPNELLLDGPLLDSANIAFDASANIFESFGVTKDDKTSPLGILRGFVEGVKETVIADKDANEIENENLDTLVREINKFLTASA